MKKSKFLQNSKDLLSRSFNPAKCKTSLRLAGSRLKLLRNKKEVQVKQMKREIAQLLESGQDQTARIRVEHVIRDEKMMAAYDLLEIYCELVVARLPIIESQKNCPIDLKEAIASLVFAAPRCGDVPELLDLRKHITAKYGKDFTTAAIELRPQCGVGRMLIVKLSASAPDGQTKTKILNAIAEEHNVKWEPTSFGERDSVSPNDRLSGPSSFMKDSEQYAEPLCFEAAQVQAGPSNNTMHNSPSNFFHQHNRTSVGQEKLVFVQTSGFSPPSQSEARPPALGDERVQEDYKINPLDGRRWNMEFKDATSAAQAAAESAERASVAARAAAELSSHGRIPRQYSTELHKPDVEILKDEGPEAHPKSKISDASITRSSSELTRLRNEQMYGIKPNYLKIPTKFKENGAGEGFSQSASSKSKASADDKSLDHGIPVVDKYSQTSFIKEEVSDDEMRADKQSFSYENEINWPEKAENVDEGKIGKQHSIKSFHSQPIISDDVNILSSFENDSSETLFVGIDEIGLHVEAPEASSHEFAAVFFDNYDSDINDHGIDKGPTYDERESDFHLSSFGQKSPERLSVNTDSLSPRASSSKIMNSTSSLFFTRESLSPDLSENTTLRNDLELNSAPVTFDESDGPNSESNDGMNIRHIKQNEMGQSETGQPVESPFKHEENSVFYSENLSLSSDDEFGSSTEMRWKRNQVNIFDEDSSQNFNIVMPSTDQPALRPKESQMKSKEIGDESIHDTGERLNFGELTGGFRHKGHNHLPFIKNRSDVSLSVKKEADTTSAINTAERTMLDHTKSSRTQDVHYYSDSDSSEEEEFLQRSSDRKKAFTAVKEIKTKSNSFFGSDNSDLDEKFPKESVTRKSHVRSGISRRTKVASSASKTNSHMKSLTSEALDSENPKKSDSQRRNSDERDTYKQSTSAKSHYRGPPEQVVSEKETYITKQESEAHDPYSSLGRKPANSYFPDTRQECESRRKSSQLGNSEQPTPMKLASTPTSSSLLGTSEKPKSEKLTFTTMQEPKVPQKSCMIEEPSSHQPKAEASIGSESTSNKDESIKKASHVHPKLPDYDTLLQSLGRNRS